jgi:hypothetical protein
MPTRPAGLNCDYGHGIASGFWAVGPQGAGIAVMLAATGLALWRRPWPSN